MQATIHKWLNRVRGELSAFDKDVVDDLFNFRLLTTDAPHSALSETFVKKYDIVVSNDFHIRSEYALQFLGVQPTSHSKVFKRIIKHVSDNQYINYHGRNRARCDFTWHGFMFFCVSSRACLQKSDVVQEFFRLSLDPAS